jgi:hypothetical protein
MMEAVVRIELRRSERFSLGIVDLVRLLGRSLGAALSLSDEEHVEPIKAC